MDPECFFAKCLLEAWGTKEPHISQKRVGFFAFPPKAARPRKHVFLEHVWFFGLDTPGHFGIPLRVLIGLQWVVIGFQSGLIGV